jgi:hypothetical protein
MCVCVCVCVCVYVCTLARFMKYYGVVFIRMNWS